MNKYHPFMLTAVLTVISSAVIAEPVSYTFASIKYSNFSSIMNGFPDDIDGEAIAIDLSLALRPNIAIVAGYNKGNADVSSSGLTFSAGIESLSMGLVAHLAINATTDFLLGASFINGDINVDGNYSGSEDINGGMSVIGIRSRISNYLELDGFVRKYSITDASSISISLAAAYFVNKSVSIDLGVSLDTDGNAWTLGATRYF